MKKILCYGDSNTFGFNPKDASRYDENTRWTSVLGTILKNEYTIFEEGGNDRTGFVDNPKGFLFSAQRHFPKLLSQIKEVDIIILWVGTNDLQFQYDINFQTVEKGLENLILKAKDKTDNIILIPSLILRENVLNGFFKIQFDETSISKSRKVGRIYKKLAQIYNCKFFDINKIATPSDTDGLHFDEVSHKLIADSLADFIRKEYGYER